MGTYPNIYSLIYIVWISTQKLTLVLKVAVNPFFYFSDILRTPSIARFALFYKIKERQALLLKA